MAASSEGLTAEESALLLADLPTLPDEFALPLPPPPAESSEVELDLLAMQLEDERLRKAMEARLCSFEADRAELREMMTSAADSSGGGADAAEFEEDAGRAARQRAVKSAEGRRARSAAGGCCGGGSTLTAPRWRRSSCLTCWAPSSPASPTRSFPSSLR
jgi:hypothetical protein